MLPFIALLALGVVYLAVRSPDPNQGPNSENPGPNQNVPMLGNVGNPSPAMSGGTPVASQVFRTAMSVNAGIVTDDLRKVSASFNVRQLAAPIGTFQPPSQTVSEMGKTLMTQAPQPLASVWRGTPPASPLIKI